MCVSPVMPVTQEDQNCCLARVACVRPVCCQPQYADVNTCCSYHCHALMLFFVRVLHICRSLAQSVAETQMSVRSPYYYYSMNSEVNSATCIAVEYMGLA